MTAVLELKGLEVAYRQGRHLLPAVRDIDLQVEPGQTYGLVGESGSGKSTLALAVMNTLPTNGLVTAGVIQVSGTDIYELDAARLRTLWRENLKLVPQNPLPSLNPSHTVGRQLAEALGFQRVSSTSTPRVHQLLARVRLGDVERVAGSYPHQLSGGMQQRVMIAMALAGTPKLLVLDEPTTNLDVTTEAAILDLVRELVREQGTAVLYVSHSLGVVSQLCDRVAVLYAGELMEDAPVGKLYHSPLHPYTRGLLDSIPQVGLDKTRASLRPIPGQIPSAALLPNGCIFAERCPVAIDICFTDRPHLEAIPAGRRVRCHRWREIAGGAVTARQQQPAPPQSPASRERPAVLELKKLHKHFEVRRSLPEALTGVARRYVRALDGIDLTVQRGRTLGLVGESGSGKSTLSKTVIGLVAASRGEVILLDIPLARNLAERDRATLRHLQMVFQSSEEALNPYRSVGQTLRRPFQRLQGLGRAQADARVADLLRAVKLDPSYAGRRPSQLSGGERQRVAIARAFAAQPDLLLFDESVSGLDVSVQAAILNLLSDLQAQYLTAYLFISHDLSVVSYLADDIAVIYLGLLMELGPTASVLEPPYHPYTEALLTAVPPVDPFAERPVLRLQGEVPSAVDIPSGCRFHTRCPRIIGDICRTQEPPWQDDGRGHLIYCHIPLEELTALQTHLFGRRTIRDEDEDADTSRGIAND